MNHLIRVLVVITSFSFTSVALAEKIAVVSLQAAILQSSYGKAELEKLQKDKGYAALLTEQQTLAADLQSLDRDAQSNGSKWNTDQQADYSKKRQFFTADMNLNNQKLKAEQERVVRQIYSQMNQKAGEALQALIKEEGVTLLLDENAVRFSAPEHNLTAKLAAKLTD